MADLCSLSEFWCMVVKQIKLNIGIGHFLTLCGTKKADIPKNKEAYLPLLFYKKFL